MRLPQVGGDPTGGMLPNIYFPSRDLLIGLAISIALGLATGIFPTIRAMRLRVAERILGFTTEVRQLESFLPICGYCKKVRDDHNYWQQIEEYINTRTGTNFSHGVCPDCIEKVLKPQLAKLGITMPPITTE